MGSVEVGAERVRRGVPTPIRSDAMWLAQHWAQVEAHFNLKLNCDLHQPTNIRTTCRKAVCVWAAAKLKRFSQCLRKPASHCSSTRRRTTPS